MVFASQGQPPAYEEMSLALFINGYLSILAEELDIQKSLMLQHLKELVDDTEVYGRRGRMARDYHAA